MVQQPGSPPPAPSRSQAQGVAYDRMLDEWVPFGLAGYGFVNYGRRIGLRVPACHQPATAAEAIAWLRRWRQLWAEMTGVPLDPGALISIVQAG